MPHLSLLVFFDSSKQRPPFFWWGFPLWQAWGEFERRALGRGDRAGHRGRRDDRRCWARGSRRGEARNPTTEPRLLSFLGFESRTVGWCFDRGGTAGAYASPCSSPPPSLRPGPSRGWSLSLSFLCSRRDADPRLFPTSQSLSLLFSFSKNLKQ